MVANASRDRSRLQFEEGSPKYTSRLPNGVLSLSVCVDSEDPENDAWPLEECMRDLLEDGCNPNCTDLTGRKLVFYVLQHKKLKSLKMLLEYGLDFKVTDKDGVTSPFGLALI
jgi:hypothetical protein